MYGKVWMKKVERQAFEFSWIHLKDYKPDKEVWIGVSLSDKSDFEPFSFPDATRQHIFFHFSKPFSFCFILFRISIHPLATSIASITVIFSQTSLWSYSVVVPPLLNFLWLNITRKKTTTLLLDIESRHTHTLLKCTLWGRALMMCLVLLAVLPS